MFSKKRQLLAFTFFTSVLFSHLQADNTILKLENQIAELHEQLVSLQNQKEPTRSPQNAAPYRDNKGIGLFVTGEILYWRANENGLGYVIESTSPETPLHGNLRHPHFEWDVGGRVGIGYKIPCDGWDLYLSGLRFHNDAHASVEANCDYLFPIWTNALFNSGETIDSARVHWRLHLGIFDLELGRAFKAGNFLTLRSFVGLRTAWIRQKYNIDYEGGSLFPLGQDEVHMKNKFWGIGVRLGLNTNWFLGKGFSIYANGAFSLLQGHFYVHQCEVANVEPFERLKIHDRFRMGSAITDLGIGLTWERLFSSGRYHIALSAGWEQHIFFSQNQLHRFVNSEMQGAHVSNQGDLTTQGLTAGLRFDF